MFVWPAEVITLAHQRSGDISRKLKKSSEMSDEIIYIYSQKLKTNNSNSNVAFCKYL
jgi:hypothetical protein